MSSPRIAVVVVTVALVIGIDRATALPNAADVRAQGATTVELGVFDSNFIVHTTEPKPPLVVVTDPETTVGLAIDPFQFDPKDPLRWSVDYFDFDSGGAAPIKPGMRIDITDGGRKTRVEVPHMSATSDADTDVVTGRVPWPGEVTVQLAVEHWLVIDAEPIPPMAVTTDADGRFRLDVGAAHDLSPGWWGTATVVSPEGHVFRTAFAEPFMRIPNELGRMMSVRADAGAAVVLVVVDASGVAMRRTIGSIPFMNGLQTPLLPFDPDAVPEPLWSPGQTLRLEIDGRTAVESVLRGARARYDPEIGTIAGHAAAGAWIRSLFAEFRPAKESTTTVDGSGRFELRVDPHPFGYADAAPFLVRTGPASAESYEAVAPTERVQLFGNRLEIEHTGFGPLELVVEPSTGGPALRRYFHPVWYETSKAYDLYDAAGQPIILTPGDRLTSRPEGGTDVSFVIPSLTVTYAKDRQMLLGSAPPLARMDVQWTMQTPDVWNLLSPDPWRLRWGTTFDGSTVADDAGHYAMSCEPKCPPAQVIARASVQLTTPGAGRPQPSLHYLAAPISGVSIDTAHLHGFATSGSPVRVALLDATDGALAVRETLASTAGEAHVPSWTTSWLDRFPDGIPAGTRFGITVAGQTMTLTVPAARPIVADVLTDRVRGGGPSGDRIDVWVLPNRADVAGRDTTKATTVVGADGRWEVAYATFDLRAGDDLLINSAAGDGRTFFQLNVLSIDGPIEPTRTPTSEPTFTPRATPTRSRSTPGAGARAYLPWAGRGVTPRRGSGLPDPPFPRRESGVQHGAGAQRHVQAVAHTAHRQLDDRIGQR